MVKGAKGVEVGKPKKVVSVTVIWRDEVAAKGVWPLSKDQGSRWMGADLSPPRLWGGYWCLPKGDGPELLGSWGLDYVKT